MFNSKPQVGWGASGTTAPPNPFESVAPPPSINPFLKQAPNPFAPSNKPTPQGPVYNPFAPSTTPFNPFSQAKPPSFKRSVSPSGKQGADGHTKVYNPFETAKKPPSSSVLPEQPARATHWSTPSSDANIPTEGTKLAPSVQSNKFGPSAPRNSSMKRNNRSDGQDEVNKNKSSSIPTGLAQQHTGFGPNIQITAPHGMANGSSTKHNGRSSELASKIQQQLSKDRIRPPQWPANPGSHSQRQAMETFRESYKLYREKARKSLIKAGLIDDPNQRRTLEQALDFRGISEDMCPEWEKITRIIEYDVRNPEKAPDDSGDLVANPSLMVKRLARSAAGQDAPLPMDVRSFPTLRKSLDYLINDLIPDDSLLPSKHNFLWDRTRAIRIDLSVQKYNLTPDERVDLLYCLETIARFHVTSLHLLSKNGFAAEDFSEQQEIEQLGKTLISLKELYDDCVEQGIECENEAEFRGYYIVFNARNPSIKETVEGWGTRLWNTDGIRTAMCLVESMQNTWSMQGPLHPFAPTELALAAASIFFSIVSSPEISYTMACFAEIHFNDVRKSMLQIIRGSYTRPRDGPKDITPNFLKERLRFDTEEEAVDFAQKHGIVFGQNGAHQYAILNSRQSIDDPRIRHAFSQSIVEHKRSGRSLPDVIHQTVYQEDNDKSTATDESSLFVTDVEDTSANVFGSLSNGDDTDTPNSTIPLTLEATTEVPGPVVVNSASHEKVSAPSPSIFAPSTQNSKPGIQEPLVMPATGQPVSSKPTTSIFAQSYSAPETRLNPFANVNESGQSNTPSPHPTSSAALQGNQAATLSSKVPSSIFGTLNQGNDESPKPAANQPAPTSIFSAPSKPSLFSSTVAGEQSPIISTKPATTMPPNLLAPSSAPPPIQRSLFQPAQPKVATTNVGASFLGSSSSAPFSLSNPNLPLAMPETNAPNTSVSTTNSVSIFSPAKQEKSHTIERAPSLTAPTASVSRKDPMGDFTRWFVLGDNGLMETELEKFAVEHFLRLAWEDFKAAEKERIRKEEDEKSWAEALKYRHYSLKVTYFYRWLRITRKQRVIKRIKLEKEKARKWKSPHNVALREVAERTKKENAIQEAKELVERRSKGRAQDSAMMRESTQSRDSLDEALLGTSVFSGVSATRAAAYDSAQDDDAGSEVGMSMAERLKLRSENQRRRKRGLPPLRQFPEAKVSKPGTKTAMLRAISRGAGPGSLSMSTGSLRNSTISSSFRSSLGYNHNRVAKSRSSVSDPYWRMKANGLVQMPNGEYLHESLALPMLQEGKRFPGLGDYGLPPQPSFTPSHSPPAVLDLSTQFNSPTPIGFADSNGASTSPSNYEGTTQKRKREQPEDDDLAVYRIGVPTNRKRAKSSDRASQPTSGADQDFLASIAMLLDKVEAVAKSSVS